MQRLFSLEAIARVILETPHQYHGVQSYLMLFHLEGADSHQSSSASVVEQARGPTIVLW